MRTNVLEETMKDHKEKIKSDKIIQCKEKDNYKIYIISDIHSHLEVFDRLLMKLKMEEQDYLFILGDFINKGKDSLAMVHRIMELSTRERTYVLKGNHELFMTHILLYEENIDKYFDYLAKDRYRTLIHDMCISQGINIYTEKNRKKIVDILRNVYKDEIEYMNTLPVVAFFDKFIFVHGGYEKKVDIEKEENKLLKFDDYNERAMVQEKTVIVGHWPVSNLRAHIHTNIPYFNKEKNIISIDGGIGVKGSGELNAFIIEKQKGEVIYQYIQENSFKEGIVTKEHRFETEEKIFITFPNYEIEMIEKGKIFSKCKHIYTGKIFSVFTSLLEEREGKVRLKTNYINHFINVKKGEKVEVCKYFEDCVLIKYKDEFGWLLKEQIENKGVTLK